MAIRIVKRTYVDKQVQYVIQQKHWIFKWWWVDAACNSSDIVNCIDSFGTLEEAKKNLCYFDGSKYKDEVIG